MILKLLCMHYSLEYLGDTAIAPGIWSNCTQDHRYSRSWYSRLRGDSQDHDQDVPKRSNCTSCVANEKTFFLYSDCFINVSVWEFCFIVLANGRIALYINDHKVTTGHLHNYMHALMYFNITTLRAL